MRVVLDTNIVVSGLLFGGAPFDVLSLAGASLIEVVTSDAALCELLDVLSRPKFADRLGTLGVTPSQAVSGFGQVAILVEPGPLPHICSDASDDLFIAIALAGRADVIVSGDHHLLQCGEQCPVPVVTPSRFLEAFRQKLQIK